MSTDMKAEVKVGINVSEISNGLIFYGGSPLE